MTDLRVFDMDQSALDHTEAATAMQKPLHVRIARYVSNILAPVTVSVPLVFLIAFYHTSNIARSLAYAAMTLFFLSIGPFIYILIGVRLGKLSDVDVSKRTQRFGPFAFGLASICLGWLILSLTHAPAPLITTMLITVISGLIMLMITLWWKISLHASTLGGAATVLTFFYGTIMLPAFALLVLVSWSRVVLHRHTVGQVVAGSLLSITLTALMLRLFGA